MEFSKNINLEEYETNRKFIETINLNKIYRPIVHSLLINDSLNTPVRTRYHLVRCLNDYFQTFQQVL